MTLICSSLEPQSTGPSMASRCGATSSANCLVYSPMASMSLSESLSDGPIHINLKIRQVIFVHPELLDPLF